MCVTTHLEDMGMKRLMIFVLVFCLSASVANAGLITAVANRGADDDPGAYIMANLIDEVLAYHDRPTHELEEIPAYMLGADWIQTANDDRDNDWYELDVTVSEACSLYLWIDNRVGNPSDDTTPPQLGPNQMLWVEYFGWADTGDDMAIDEGGDGDIDQRYSIFTKDVDAGLTTLYAQNFSGKNMYGVAAVPEPMTIALLGLGTLGLIRRKRS